MACILMSCGAPSDPRDATSTKARARYYAAYCEAQGLEFGTNAFANCVYALSGDYKLDQIQSRFFEAALK